jgi:hypothetical protein
MVGVRRSLLVPCVALASVLRCLAQEPEYENVAQFLEDGALKPLERQTIAITARSKAVGLGGVTTSATVKGTRSPVRFSTDKNPEIIVRASSQKVDPYSVMQLYKFEIAKGERRVDTVKGGHVFGGKVSASAAKSAVTFEASKHGESSFKVTPSQPLEPGEYMVLISDPTKFGSAAAAFCFGVDPK